MRHSHITINHAHLRHNLQIIKRHAPNAKVMAMVKADAYGHGVTHAVPALMQADAFGVATLSEGLTVAHVCAQMSANKHIVLMEGVFSAEEWRIACEQNFGCVIHCQEQLDWALSMPAKPESFTHLIWLKYNTGMNRLGFDREKVLNAAKLLSEKGYRLILTSHFACADDEGNPINALQIQRFQEVLTILQNNYEGVQGSLCNSAGIINFSHTHHDWVRAGIALYGGTPIASKSADELGLLPVMTFSTQIFAIHNLSIGEQVGYGGLWTADKPSRIGVLSTGYGDGYPRVVMGAKVLIIKENQSYITPIIGRVAMDMMMIDLTGLPVDVGDDVILWGDSLSADQVAIWANTISYELFCKITYRPTRRIV